jgi:hypothetical protein
MMERIGWAPGMERGAANEEARQVKCLIASEGHLWMSGYFDRLPGAVRRRLAYARHNICPACMVQEAQRVAKARGRKRPSVADYFDVIEAIEQDLDFVG